MTEPGRASSGGADALVAVARRLAEDVLLPAAADVDRATAVPADQLDLLAEAGLYGAAAPAAVGGAGLDPPTFALVTEALAGGCLATAFVWVQHHGLVRALAGADARPELRGEWLAPLAAGECRSGAAYGGLLPGPPRLGATPAPDGGWRLDGESPWVTGWGLVDVLHVAARGPDDTVVWVILDAVERAGLRADRQRLVAVEAASTVRLRFAGVPVPAERVTAVVPYEPLSVTGPALRTNGSLALGVAGRCIALIGPGAPAAELAAELAAGRAALDAAVTAADAMPAARAAAAELAVRAAAALAVTVGASSVVAGSHPERLTREALFLLVFGTRPAIRAALLDRLGTAR